MKMFATLHSIVVYTLNAKYSNVMFKPKLHLKKTALDDFLITVKFYQTFMKCRYHSMLGRAMEVL